MLTVIEMVPEKTVSRKGTIFGKWELEPASLVQTDVNTCLMKVVWGRLGGRHRWLERLVPAGSTVQGAACMRYNVN
jgi:hypothetical protein